MSRIGNSTASPLPAVVTRDLADSLFQTSAGRWAREFWIITAEVSLPCLCSLCLQKTDDYARYGPFCPDSFPGWFYGTSTSRSSPYGYVRRRIRIILQPFLSGYDVAAAGRSILSFDIQSYKDQKIERDAAGNHPRISAAQGSL